MLEVPQPAQVQRKAQPEQSAFARPRRGKWARDRAGQSGREHALGRWSQATRCRPSPKSHCRPTKKICCAAGSSRGPEAYPVPRKYRRASPVTDHWAFAPAASPGLPAPIDHRPVRTAVDRFIQKRARRSRARPRTRRRPRHFDPPRHLRPDGPTPFSPRSRRLSSATPDPTPTRISSTGCWPRLATASAGASTGWMLLATPIPTATSAPIPTGRWPIATATMSSAHSTPIGRSTRSSANNWPATSWPAIAD